MVELEISQEDLRLIKKALLEYANNNYMLDYSECKDCFYMYVELNKICY